MFNNTNGQFNDPEMAYMQHEQIAQEEHYEEYFEYEEPHEEKAHYEEEAHPAHDVQGQAEEAHEVDSEVKKSKRRRGKHGNYALSDEALAGNKDAKRECRRLHKKYQRAQAKARGALTDYQIKKEQHEALQEENAGLKQQIETYKQEREYEHEQYGYLLWVRDNFDLAVQQKVQAEADQIRYNSQVARDQVVAIAERARLDSEAKAQAANNKAGTNGAIAVTLLRLMHGQNEKMNAMDAQLRAADAIVQAKDAEVRAIQEQVALRDKVVNCLEKQVTKLEQQVADGKRDVADLKLQARVQGVDLDAPYFIEHAPWQMA